MKLIPETYKKYGYRMYNCTLNDLLHYKKNCYHVKKVPNPAEEFGYCIFENVDDAIKKINFCYTPAEHGSLPHTIHSFAESNQLLIKEITFYKPEHQILYQTAVETAWALDGHLDPRVQQFYYD